MYKECHARLCIVMLMLTLKLKQQTLETEFNQLECVAEVCASKWMTAIFPLPPEGDVGLRNILSERGGWAGGGCWALLSESTPVSSQFSHTAPSQTWVQIHLTSPLCFSWLVWRDAESRITRCLIQHTMATSVCITADIVALSLLHFGIRDLC